MKNMEKSKLRGMLKKIRFNKITVIFIFIYFLFTLGGTYAYYAYQVEDTVAITGNVVSIDADLEVDLVVGTNTKMVPMDDEALSNALNGVGSTNGACVDAVGNLSCQVYRIKLINNGSRLKNLNGTIKLYPKEGSGNAYTNLKWRELSNTTTVKSGSVINGMNESFLVEDLTINSKTTMTWYIAVWISEADYDQRETDKGLFGGTVKFDAGAGSSGGSSSTITPFIRDVMAVSAVSDKDIDFSKTSAQSNTNGIYYVEDTKNNSNPIYYYRGAVDNNLLFADTCWKIVRTTETGGLKLIYNGTPSSGTCNNTGDATHLGLKSFNSSYSSPAYVGYMYGTPYETGSYVPENWESIDGETGYMDFYNGGTFGNSVTYSNGTYTLTDTYGGNNWDNIDTSTDLNSYHYTCFTDGTTCSTVYYIYYTNNSSLYYITLTGGKTVEDALEDMLDNNTTSSTIKGNSTTEGTLDYWYYNNIEQAGYSDYIEDTVWCNDRSISNLNGWDPDGGSITSYLYFSGRNRAYSTYEPSLTCSRDIDKFTVNESNGNGDLDYPVGLLTSDEIMLAGGKNGSGNSTYYLYARSSYWVGSPYGFYYNDAEEFFVYSAGYLHSNSGNNARGVRPSISLKAGFTISGGDGTTGSPYVVDTNESSGSTPIPKKTATFYNGSSSIGTQEIESGVSDDLTSWSSLGGSVRSGYTGWSFAGWSTSSSASSVDYTNSDDITITEDTSLYAVYSRDLTVSYNANGGSGNVGSTTKTIYVNSNSTTTSSQEVTLAANAFSRTGYTFSKWLAGSTSGSEYSVSSTYNPNIAYNASTFGITMYAKWTPETYTVSYDANGGTGAPASQTKTYGENLTLSSTVPTREGYTFSGWSTSSTATTATYASGGVYDTNAAATLYAVWRVSNFINDVIGVKAKSDEKINFCTSSNTSGTNGIYYIEDTINTPNPIYYYRGKVDNNLIFAETCWKIVRTTDTGGLKLIYNGVPKNGTCTSMGVSSDVGSREFNLNSNSLAYVGYMYGNPYKYMIRSVGSSSTAFVYGNTVTYSGGSYTLTNTIASSNWASIYNGGLNNYHYTCWTTGTKCTAVYYIHYTTSANAIYISLTNGKTVEDALEEMLDNNITSSKIKGNNENQRTLEIWYYTNMYQTGYSDYIEDTVWCNDRSIYDYGGWNPNGGNTTSDLYFSSYNRVANLCKPSVICPREIDSFTVSQAKGNGDLDYPVGLLTADEIILAGGAYSISNTNYYLFPGSSDKFYTNSPYGLTNSGMTVGMFSNNGGMLFTSTVSSTDVSLRPVISLKSGFTIISGDGTTSSPYIVD